MERSGTLCLGGEEHIVSIALGNWRIITHRRELETYLR